MPDPKLKWNKRLELLRVAADLTQAQAAERIGVPLGTYGRWERGDHRPMFIHQEIIVGAFNVNIEDIFKDEEETE